LNAIATRAPHGVTVEWDEKRGRMIGFHVTLLNP
jgi:hypothetical protein